MTQPFKKLYTFCCGQGHPWEDFKLKRHIRRLLTQIVSPEEKELIRFLLINLDEQTDDGQLHGQSLTSYATHFIRSPVLRIQQPLKEISYINDRSNSFQDLFSIALQLVSTPIEFYQNYQIKYLDEQYGLNSFNCYIRRRIMGLLRDKIRLMEGWKTYGRSQLGLVVKSTNKQMRTALQRSGFQDAKLAQSELLWECFQEIRKGYSREFSEKEKNFPPEMFCAIADRYNFLRKRSSDALVQDKPMTPDLAENWLKEMGQAIRRYLDPPQSELDRPMGDREQSGSFTLQETIAAPLVDSEVEDSLPLGMGGALAECIQAQIGAMSLDQQRVLVLLYGIGMVQTEIAQELSKNQSTVGRQQKRAIQACRDKLGEWLQAETDIALSTETLPVINDVLKETIGQHYQERVDYFYRQIYAQLSPEVQELLSLKYIRGYDLECLSKQLSLSARDVQQRIERSLDQIEAWVRKAVEDFLQRPLQTESAAVKLRAKTEIWLGLNGAY